MLVCSDDIFFLLLFITLGVFLIWGETFKLILLHFLSTLKLILQVDCLTNKDIVMLAMISFFYGDSRALKVK